MIRQLIGELAERVAKSGVMHIEQGSDLYNGISDLMKSYAMQVLRKYGDTRHSQPMVSSERMDEVVYKIAAHMDDLIRGSAVIAAAIQKAYAPSDFGLQADSGSGYPAPPGNAFKTAGLFPDDCSTLLRQQKKPYPRTCARCKLGPCPYDRRK